MYSLDRHNWREYVKHPIASFLRLGATRAKTRKQGAKRSRGGSESLPFAENPSLRNWMEQAVTPPAWFDQASPRGNHQTRTAGEFAYRSGQLYLRCQEPLWKV